MPRVIHLNGPPGIGKSTIAQLYVDEHPGTLNLDIDRVQCLIGGWRDDFWRARELWGGIAPDVFLWLRTCSVTTLRSIGVW